MVTAQERSLHERIRIKKIKRRGQKWLIMLRDPREFAPLNASTKTKIIRMTLAETKRSRKTSLCAVCRMCVCVCPLAEKTLLIIVTFLPSHCARWCQTTILRSANGGHQIQLRGVQTGRG